MINFLELLRTVNLLQHGNMYRLAKNHVMIGPINISDYSLVLVEDGKLITPNELSAKTYSRAQVYVMPNDYQLNTSEKFLRLVGRKCIISFTVNQAQIIMQDQQQLLLEMDDSDNSADGQSGLITAYKKYRSTLFNHDEFGHEMFRAVIDDPEMGIMGDKLYIVNKDDEYITRVMMFEHVKGKKNKQDSAGFARTQDSISIFYYSESMQDMRSHVLSRYFKIVGTEVMAEIDLDMNGKIIADTSSTINVSIRNIIKADNIKEVVKLFSRKSTFDD